MLVYAINEDGRAVHVDEVANGKACGCVCPQCGGALVAYNKIGKLREQGLSTIEVDLSCVDGGISREDLSAILLGDSVLKQWVYSAKAEQIQRRHPRSERRRAGVRLCDCEDHGMVNGADRFEWCPPGNHLHYGDCMNCINCVDADIRVRHGRYGRFARVEAVYCDVDAAKKRAAARKKAD